MTTKIERRIKIMKGTERKDLFLSKKDQETIDTCIKDYPTNRIILFLNTCGPIDISAYPKEKVQAIFAIFLPGMEGAHALADLLIGRANPSGKLPVTFPKRYEDTPTYLNFPGDGYEVTYGEGIFVGYRYYDKKKIEPEFSFGYGLSYTTFAEIGRAHV